MQRIVDRFRGWGLSAPQVGAAVRVTLAKLSGNIESEATVLINPVITARSVNMRMVPEGCLSIPGWETRLLRHKAITVRYLDRELKPCMISLSNTAAQVIQHEEEHLNGRLLTERVSKGALGRITAGVEKAREALGG
jgi:peptide deformylase